MKTRNLAIFPFLIIFYAILTYLSNDMYLPALFDLMRDFNTTTSMAQLTLTTWFLGSASTQLIMGPLSDHYGRRPILLLGGMIFIVSSILCAATHSMFILLIARFLQGSAVCSLMVAGYATVHELYDTKQAIHILALIGSVGILAPAFGPLLGSFILTVATWRFMFLLLAAGAVAAIILLFKWMPESNPLENRTPIAFKKIVKSYCSIITNINFILATLVLCLIYSGLIAWLTIGPLLITEALHLTPMMFGLYQALIFGSFILGNIFLKYTIPTIGLTKTIHYGLIVTVCGALFSLLSAIYFHSIIGFIVALMIYAGGAALQYGTLQRIAIEMSHEPMGLRMAIFSSLLGIAGVLASSVSSYIYIGKPIQLAYFLVIVSVIAFVINVKRMKQHIDKN